MTEFDRKTQLLDLGARLAAKNGAANVTRKMVAGAAKVSEALVSAYFGTMGNARALFKKHAKKLGLPLPTKDEEVELGVKLRSHGPRVAKKPAPAVAKKLAPAVAKKKKPAPATATPLPPPPTLPPVM